KVQSALCTLLRSLFSYILCPCTRHRVAKCAEVPLYPTAQVTKISVMRKEYSNCLTTRGVTLHAQTNPLYSEYYPLDC
ncbi:hypothetical protein JB92DRAFT_3161142, partial [Gautieria morchelliformis]